MARDAALLSRAKAPHNMDRKQITFGVDGHGSFVHADGGPAAYDGSGLLLTHFTHPIFPKAGSDRATWHWTPRPGQRGFPFIEKAVEEVTHDSDLMLSAAIQDSLDAESA